MKDDVSPTQKPGNVDDYFAVSRLITPSTCTYVQACFVSGRTVSCRTSPLLLGIKRSTYIKDAKRKPAGGVFSSSW